MEGLTETVAVTDQDLSGVEVALILGLVEVEGLVLGLIEGLVLAEELSDGLVEGLLVVLILAVMLLLRLVVLVTVTDGVPDTLALVVSEGLKDADGDSVADMEGVLLLVTVDDAVRLAEGVTVGVRVKVLVAVGLGLASTNSTRAATPVLTIE